MVKLYDALGHTAMMARFEKRQEAWRQVGEPWRVMVGRNGLGKEREGDGKTPTGIFLLEDVYGYRQTATKMPFFLMADDNLICVDDTRSRYYNRIVDKRRVVKDFGSYETMHREDGLYEIVVTMGYNREKTPGKGSCIFLHIANGDKPTAGCVAMEKKRLSALVAWLDPAKKPVIVVERWTPAARFARLYR
ncbi:L,D-transpeptidase family protein [Hydrogenimonas urashimensis]|uniref:L,D-transpeptidase family protein n=1 Tax=Hydrogenimonas urashimensis TaxID=2740515 RepID=UPI001916202A|nr:L,D-transpeptidase family protein [Hydrogenimonas urashimensis]